MRPHVLFVLAVLALEAVPVLAQTAPMRGGPPPLVVEASDFGVVADAAVNNARALQTALDRAGYLQRRAPGRVAEVVLPCHRPFAASGEAIGYAGETAIPDSVALVGCGGTEVVPATDEHGHRYRPVREVAAAGRSESRLRVLDGSVYDAGTGPLVTRFGVAPGATWFALRDVVLDGNWRGNLAAYAAIPEAVQKPYLQDGNGWAALALDGSAGRPECRPPSAEGGGGGRLHVELRRIAITGYGANGIVGTECVEYDGEAVRLGSALHNHVFYGGNAVFRGLTLEGFAWTHMVVMADVDVSDLVYEDPARNPSGRWNPELVNVRAGALTVRGMHADTRLATTGGSGGEVVQLLRSDEGRADLDGLVWLARDAGSLGSAGDGGVFRHGRVYADHLALLLGGVYHGAPPRDGRAHVYVQDVEVAGRLGGLFEDRGSHPVLARLDGVRASGLFVLGGPADDGIGAGPPGALALTDSALRLDPAASVHTGGHLMGNGRGAYLTPPTNCADAATRAASGPGGGAPLALNASATEHCLALLATPIPPAPGPPR
jgi:hypothetical protein